MRLSLAFYMCLAMQRSPFVFAWVCSCGLRMWTFLWAGYTTSPRLLRHRLGSSSPAPPSAAPLCSASSRRWACGRARVSSRPTSSDGGESILEPAEESFHRRAVRAVILLQHRPGQVVLLANCYPARLAIGAPTIGAKPISA